ncbi:hypothetical protein [Sphingopyxis fribergensis]
MRLAPVRLLIAATWMASGYGAAATAAEPAHCPASDFNASNHRFRTELKTLGGRPGNGVLAAWMKTAHCTVAADRGVHLSFATRKAVMFEIGNEFARRQQPCSALQAVGMVRARGEPELSGFWNSGSMQASQAQTINSYLAGCLRRDATPFGRPRYRLFSEVVRRLAKPSRFASDLRTVENRRLSHGARLAQSLLDSLDLLLILDYGKEPEDKRVAATRRALVDTNALYAWEALWKAMDGRLQRPISSCLSVLRRTEHDLERNLMKARALAGSRGTC